MGVDVTRNHSLVKGAEALWSPDGTRIAYFAPGEPTGTQLFERARNDSGHGVDFVSVPRVPLPSSLGGAAYLPFAEGCHAARRDGDGARRVLELATDDWIAYDPSPVIAPAALTMTR